MTGPDPTRRFDRIAVIIVNYGTADLTIAAVESVRARSHGGRRVSIHVVDNASPDGDALTLQTAAETRGWQDQVVFWPETENHGFARGNNVVLRALAREATPPDAVFLLNPDARLDNEAIDILATTLEDTPQAATAGAGLLRPDMIPVTGAFRFPGPLNEIARTVNLSRFDRLVETSLVALPASQPEGLVDWVSGASVMFRFSALQEVDFFHPGFFLYYEEVDLMRRLNAQGWTALYQPQARVVHEEGAATGQFGLRSGRRRNPPYLYRSWGMYFTRAYGRPAALGIALVMVPAAVLNMLHRGVRGLPPTLPRGFVGDHFRYVIRPLLFGSGAG